MNATGVSNATATNKPCFLHYISVFQPSFRKTQGICKYLPRVLPMAKKTKTTCKNAEPEPHLNNQVKCSNPNITIIQKSR